MKAMVTMQGWVATLHGQSLLWLAPKALQGAMAVKGLLKPQRLFIHQRRAEGPLPLGMAPCPQHHCPLCALRAWALGDSYTGRSSADLIETDCSSHQPGPPPTLRQRTLPLLPPTGLGFSFRKTLRATARPPSAPDCALQAKPWQRNCHPPC